MFKIKTCSSKINNFNYYKNNISTYIWKQVVFNNYELLLISIKSKSSIDNLLLRYSIL